MTCTNCIERFGGDFAFLDNGAPSAIILDGVGYPTLEHAYHASKTRVAEMRAVIRDAPAPHVARRLAAWLTPPANWRAIRLEVMADLLAQKHAPGSALADKLLATADAELQYGNLWGAIYWGVCFGVGRNHLGRLLMERRKWLRTHRHAAAA